MFKRALVSVMNQIHPAELKTLVCAASHTTLATQESCIAIQPSCISEERAVGKYVSPVFCSHLDRPAQEDEKTGL